MLEALRKASKGVTAKILLGLLVASFAVWGVSGALTGSHSTTIVEAGETVVTPIEYSLAYQREINEMSRRFNTRLTNEQATGLGVDRIVLNEVVSGAVLDEQARTLGLGISDDELAGLVGDDPAFTGFDGRFDRDRFRQVLYQVGMTEEDYVQGQVSVARRRQLLAAVASDAPVPLAYSSAIAEFDAETRDISYVVIGEGALAGDRSVDEDAFAAWFEENAARYAAPEYRGIDYVVVTPAALADPASVSVEEAREAYEADTGRFTAPAARDVQQLLFPDREAADAAAARLDAGEVTFDDLLIESEADPDTITLRGATRDTYPDQRIAETVFALEQDETSGVLDGRFGPVIVRPTLVLEEAVREFDETTDEIRRELATLRAEERVFDVVDDFEDARAGGAAFAEAAAAAGLEVVRIEAVDAAGQSPAEEPVEVPPASEFLATAFGAEIGEELPTLDLAGGGVVALEVAGIEAARPRALDEVRDRALVDYRAERDALEIGRIATEQLEAVEGGASLEDVAAAVGTTVEQAFALRRNEEAEGLELDTIRAAFGGPEGHVALATRADGSVVLLRVDAIATDAEVADPVPASVEQDLLTQFVNDLRERYRPTFNAELAAQVRAR